MVLTGFELAMLKNGLRKAGSALGHAALTGPGPGAGSVEKRLRTSRVPGLERRKQTIESADAERFARRIVERVSGQRFTLPGKAKPQRLEIPADAIDSLAAGVGILMSALPGSRVDMAVVLEVHGEPAGLADRMRVAMPEAARVVGDPWLPVLDELLGVVCEHIVEFFTTKETFSAAADLELLKQSARKYQPEEEKELLAAYTRLVQEKFQRIRLFGLDLHDEEQAYDLMTGFVELSIEASARLDGSPDRRDGLAERLSWNRMDTLIAARQRILLEGPAGSGKSTLLQWLTLRSLKFPDLKPIPFLIRLREFVSGQELRLPKPIDFIATLAEPLAGRLPGFEPGVLAGGWAAVLVDGIDEVPEQLRGKALQWLADLVVTYPRAQYVVTTRPAGLDEAWRTRLTSEHDFTKAAVDPMSAAQVSTFIDRWHEATAKRPDADPAELRECADSLKLAIRSRRDLARITATPLLCAMVCALYRADNRVLPRNRTALYDRACTMLLEKRDSHQKIQTLPVALSRDQIEPFLTEIALWMLVNKQRSIPHKDALDLVAAELPRIQVPDAPPKWKLTAPELLRHLIVRSGVLQEPTMDLVEFVHPSFQDFLAAKGVFRKNYLPHLIANAHDAMYQDVAVMAVSQVQNDRERQDQLLEGLIERAKSDRTHNRQLYLLAAACVADAGMVDPAWVKAIQKKTRSLLPPKSRREAQSVAAAGEFTLDLLADAVQRRPLTMNEASATVVAISLMGGGGEVGTRILQTLAEDFGQHVAHQLITAWHLAQDPRVFLDEVLVRGDFSDRYVISESEELLALVGRLPGMKLLRTAHRLPPGLEALEDLSTSVEGGVSVLPRLPRLRALALDGPEAANLQGIDRFPQLRELTVNSPVEIDLRPLTAVKHLAYLAITETGEPDLSPLKESAALLRLLVNGVATADLTPLASLPHFRTLSARATPITSREPLPHVTELHVDSLNGQSEILPRIKELGLDLARPDPQALACFPRLTSVRLYGPTRSIDVSPLKTLPHLSGLTVDNWGSPISGLPGLGISSLRINDPSPGLDDLRELPQLSELTLENTSGPAMRRLPTLPKVRSLALGHFFQEGPLPRWDRLPSVTSLSLAGIPWTDLASLAGLPALTALDIWSCHTADLTPLTALEGLRSLRLYHVRRIDYSVLRRLEQLTAIILDGDRDLKPEFLPRDAELTLTGTADLGAPELAAFPTLRGLIFLEPPECGFAALAQVPQLNRLSLQGCPGVSVEELAAWPNLRILRLHNVPGLDLEALTALPHLTELHLDHMPYSGIHVLPNLEVLSLGDTEVELSELRTLPKLRHLILDTVPEPDLSILASLPQLKKLELVHMPWANLTPFQARPDIEIIQR